MKNTQKHTQGPWIAYLYGKDSYGRTIATVGVNDGDNRICELCAVDLPVDSIEANAHLIAAAPDLLAALKTGVALLVGHGKPVDQAMLEAIAKAEGAK
jgi:hypothetical protein